MYSFAALTASVNWKGQTFRLVEGEVWDSSDPLVKARPELFHAEAPVVRNTTGQPARRPKRVERTVEQATKAPGEKRRGSVR